MIPGKLALGRFPGPQHRPILIQQGVKVILSLCGEREGSLAKPLTQDFRCLRVPLPDSRYSVSLDEANLAEAVDLIHWSLQKRQPIYVHCWAGMERSPLVCVAYLCHHQGFDLLDALSWVKHIHPPSRPTSAQLQVLRRYLANLGTVELPLDEDWTIAWEDTPDFSDEGDWEAVGLEQA